MCVDFKFLFFFLLNFILYLKDFLFFKKILQSMHILFFYEFYYSRRLLKIFPVDQRAEDLEERER